MDLKYRYNAAIIYSKSNRAGGKRMKITVYREPCILLEATELVYAWVNQLPAENSAPDKEFNIPVEVALRIRDAVCQFLDPEDAELQFFFRSIPFGGESGQKTCIARCLVYNTLEFGHPDPDDMAKALSQAWDEEMKGPISITGMDQYSVSFAAGNPGEFLPLSREIAKLPLPTTYQLQLLDVFSHYGVYIQRLADLLRPVTSKLSELLQPWVLKAQSRLNQWEEYLSEDNVEEFFFQSYHMKVNAPDVVEIALHYFLPRSGMLHVAESGNIARMLLGTAMDIGIKVQKKEKLSDREYSALRLIANPDRVAMLQAMMHEPMSGQELIQRLGLNSGSVFRDLNSMCNADLLIREIGKGKSIYRTNYPLLQSLFQRTLRIIAPEEDA